jgi:cyanophycin synthetase
MTSSSTKLLLNEFKIRNIPIIKYYEKDSSFIVEIKQNLIYLKGSHTPLNTQTARNLVQDKVITKDLLIYRNIPTPDSLSFYFNRGKGLTNNELESVINMINKYKRVVVKPIDGMRSFGVNTEVRSKEDFLNTYNKIKDTTSYSGILIEEFIEGDIFRLLFLNGKLIGALKREPQYIIADGIKTIEELVHDLNYELISDGRLHKDPKILSEEILNLFSRAGIDSNKIYPRNEKIVIKKQSSSIETVTEVTQLVHPDFEANLGKLCNDIGLGLAGADVITTDISDYTRSKVLEINKEPYLLFHHYPDYGRKIDVAKLIVEAIIKKYQ